jgi:hypothetical protein
MSTWKGKQGEIGAEDGGEAGAGIGEKTKAGQKTFSTRPSIFFSDGLPYFSTTFRFRK